MDTDCEEYSISHYAFMINILEMVVNDGKI